jgi:hypothetical protein
MREDLIAQLKDLVKCNEIRRREAVDILELFDDEVDDTSEFTAMDKAQQDIEIAIKGE